jgi:hypothetical protein
MMEKRTGELCPKTIIQNALEVFLADKPSTTELVHQLIAQNIRAIPNITSTGRMNGFSFEYNGIAFKASQLEKGIPGLLCKAESTTNRNVIMLSCLN